MDIFLSSNKYCVNSLYLKYLKERMSELSLSLQISINPFFSLNELSFAIKSQYPSFFQEGSNLYFNMPNLFSRRE